jgi:hypothetical protein
MMPAHDRQEILAELLRALGVLDSQQMTEVEAAVRAGSGSQGLPE